MYKLKKLKFSDVLLLFAGASLGSARGLDCISMYVNAVKMQIYVAINIKFPTLNPFRTKYSE